MSMMRKPQSKGQQNSNIVLMQSLLAPFSQEAEEAVIGGVLTSPMMYGPCSKILKAEDFYLTRHRTMWETFGRLYEREVIMDLTTIGEDLRERGVIEDIGGPAYMIHLINNTPNSMHAEAYAHLVQRTAKRRKLLMVADQIREWAMDEKMRYEEVFSQAQAALDVARPTENTRHLNGQVSIEIYANTMMQRDQDRQKGVNLTLPLPESWQTFREKVGDFQWGDVVVIGGPTGSGKSAGAECLLEHYALAGHLCSYTHTEMSHMNLLDRRHARHSGLAYHLLLTGDVMDGERAERFLAAEDFIASFAPQISYDWMPNVLMADLAAHWRAQYDAGFRVFFLDHFQDVTFDKDTAQNMVTAREKLASWVAAFAEKRNVLVIVLSQLNNEGEIKGGLKLKEKATIVLNFNRPILTSDYRYTYSNDPETVAMPGEESPVADVTINKHRFGARGKFRMFYNGPRFSWHDLRAMRSTSGLPITVNATPKPSTPYHKGGQS